MSAPTASEILAALQADPRDELWSERVYGTLVRMLNWMSAREREHAELRERVERLEKGADDGR